MSKSKAINALLYTRLPQRFCAAFLLADDGAGNDLDHWRIGVFRIVIFALLVLCVGTGIAALADAWRLHNFAAMALIFGAAIGLLQAFRLAAIKTRASASLVIVLIYTVGIWIITCARDEQLAQLGLLLLYAAPQLALIGFGIRVALLLMALNVLPLMLQLTHARVEVHTLFNNALPYSQLYVHLLLFLIFNVSMPLAFYCGFAALKRSIARYVRTNKMLSRSTMLYQDMFEHAGGPVLICNVNGSILKANRSAVALFEHELIDLMLSDIVDAQPLGMQTEALLNLACVSGSSEGEFNVRSAANAGCEILLRMKRLSAQSLLIGIKDVTHLRAAQRELEVMQAARDRLIAYDPLTNLPNLDHLRAKLRESISQRASNGDTALLGLVCIRLNSVRSINEKYGQTIGDQLICEFGRQLALRSRSDMVAARLRSVVFSLLVTGYRQQEQLLHAVEQMLNDLPSHYDVKGNAFEISLSVGMAIARGSDIAVNELIHRGERALESARKSMQRGIVIFSEDIGKEFHREIDIEIALSTALQRGEFTVVYQPKVNALRDIEGLEALLRWHSPELGHVSPAEFIPIAERNGRIHAITNFVIESVCRQQRVWLECCGKTWPVAVNLSGMDLQRENLASTILNTVKRHALLPALLQLEITETSLIENDHVAREIVETLIRAGFHVAIDDFGTGYSSLKKLSEYPIGTIKIDRSFVLAIGENPRSEQIIRLILALAKFLNCETVAEGVETIEQMQFLIENGCRRFQGYLFYRPLPEAGISALLNVSA